MEYSLFITVGVASGTKEPELIGIQLPSWVFSGLRLLVQLDLLEK
jgi:hypothetical protein